jgi:hypothetical protein
VSTENNALRAYVRWQDRSRVEASAPAAIAFRTNLIGRKPAILPSSLICIVTIVPSVRTRIVTHLMALALRLATLKASFIRLNGIHNAGQARGLHAKCRCG